MLNKTRTKLKTYLKTKKTRAAQKIKKLLRPYPTAMMMARIIYFRYFKPIKTLNNSTGYITAHYHPAEMRSTNTRHFIGANWKLNRGFKIGLCLNFSRWKWGFVSRFVDNKKLIFVDPGNELIELYYLLKLEKVELESVYYWGVCENSRVKKLLKQHNIKLIQVEDGFIRSAELGISKSTPFSLVFDDVGIYYNTQQPSYLSYLLDTFKFDKSNADDLRFLHDYLRREKITKYLKSGTRAVEKSYGQNYVLVLGQVEEDASLKWGNVDSVSQLELVRAAYKENQNNTIIYRPHPDVYKTFIEDETKLAEFEKLCIVSDIEENITDLIIESSKVYTITSLAGFEAAVLGKHVVLLGRSFYSSLGFTDDRCSKKVARVRHLSIQEAAFIIYAVYPTYLSNSGNKLQDILIVKNQIDKDCWTLRADGYLKSSTSIQDNMSDDLRLKQIFSKKASTFQSSALIENIFKSDSAFSKQVLSCLLFSQYANDKNFKDFMRARDEETYEFVSNFVLQQKLVSHSHINSEKNQDIEGRLIKTFMKLKFPDLFSTFSSTWLDSEISSNITTARHKRAEELIFYSLLTNPTPAVLLSAATLSAERYDFQSQNLISTIGHLLFPSFKNSIFAQYLFRTRLQLFGVCPENLEALSSLAFHSSSLIYPLKSLLKKQDVTVQKFDPNSLQNIIKLKNKPNIKDVNALIELGAFELAESIVEDLIASSPNTSPQFQIVLSRIYSYTGRLDESFRLASQLVSSFESQAAYSEFMRVCVLTNKYRESLEALDEAIDKHGFKISEMNRRKCYMGNLMIEEAFQTFKELRLSSYFKSIYHEKTLRESETFISLLNSENSLALLAIYGPGDEIRFASIYRRFTKTKAAKNLTISCLPKLYDLFSRSFPELKFLPCKRLRGSDLIDPQNFNRAPSQRLMGVVDNNAHDLIQSVDRALLITDVLGDFLHNYESFDRLPYLIADPERVELFKSVLSDNSKTYVGISWRSSLTTTARNEHYLEVKDLLPLFTIPNVVFVNLQYDDCEEELKFVQSKYPEKLINFDSLDQYNDLDGVAALMSSLEFVVSPATTVAELSGALGIKTILFSRSSELNWRKINKNGDDVWYPNTKIVDLQETPPEALLVDRIKTEISAHAIAKR
jgi:capsular polysaccharide export protein